MAYPHLGTVLARLTGEIYKKQKTMMTEKLQKEMNGQISAEMWSANLYLSMAFYMQREGLDGCAHWLKKQSEEETSHACQIAEYMVKRDATPLVDKVDVVPQTWGNALEVFEAVYEHECNVSIMINELVDVASAEKDKATQDFLWGFVREQVEEEATAASIVDKLKKAGDAGLLFVDAQLAERK